MNGSPRFPGPVQWPFIGLAVLLLLLILTTPGLMSLGNRSASSPSTVAELEIYRGPDAGPLHFYVRGVDPTPYARISVGFAPVRAWPPAPSANLSWGNWTNQTDTLSVSSISSLDPVAVNVTAVFVDATGASVLYRGVYAFNVTASTVVILPLLPGLSPSIPAVPLLDLPEPLPLLAVPGSP